MFFANTLDDTDSSSSEHDNEAVNTVATIRKLQPVSSAYNNIYKELAVNIIDNRKTDISNNNDGDDGDI